MEQPVHPLPLCPHSRIEFAEGESRKTIVDGVPQLVIDIPHDLLDAKSVSESLHRVSRAVGYDEGSDEARWFCGVCRFGTMCKSYECDECGMMSFHKECAESSPGIRLPCHPRHPLQSIWYAPNGAKRKLCSLCTRETPGLAYFCSLCNFCIHPVCGNNPSFVAINHPEFHEHTLTLLPRQVSFTCGACALGSDGFPIYVCLQCDLMVHGRCIYLPRVIKISRHHHRLSHDLCFPSGEWSCEVCRKKMDWDCGGYSCKRGCSYVVHSKCATRKNVWDRKVAEGEAEDDADATEQVEPFEKVDDGIIRHFSHEHHLRFNEEITACDEIKRCQACVIPVYEGNFYSCTRCGFILHETCANLPRKVQHALHPHPLTLEKVFAFAYSLRCTACFRSTNGFLYACSECDNFKLDVRCALLSESLSDGYHPHPLFFTSSWETESCCQVCGRATAKVLNCTDCEFVLCFHCATLPRTFRHKCDEHLLTLCYGEDEEDEEEEDASGSYWCHLCEESMGPRQCKWFYYCDECGVTLHTQCVLGKEPYLLHHEEKTEEMIVRPNNRMSRPICSRCLNRCQDNIVFLKKSRRAFCSRDCMCLDLYKLA